MEHIVGQIGFEMCVHLVSDIFFWVSPASAVTNQQVQAMEAPNTLLLQEFMHHDAICTVVVASTELETLTWCAVLAGLRNLIMVLFAATTFRLMIENYLKYGIRLNPKNWVLAVLTPEGDSSSQSSVNLLHGQQLLLA